MLEDNRYCKIIFIHWTFNFVFFGHEQSTNLRSHDPTKILIHFSNIAYNLKSMNPTVHEHIHRRQTMKLRSHEMKWFPSKMRTTYSEETQVVADLVHVFWHPLLVVLHHESLPDMNNTV